MNENFDVIIVGGGAAGFFSAINIKERNPKWRVAILERGKEVLSKVRISGGGRCNVTHACFEPTHLVKFYPRGERELLGPFHQFATSDTVEWFKNHGVELKIENDGRMFPVSNSSQTIIDCFLNTSRHLGISIVTNQRVQLIAKQPDCWKITSQDCDYLTPKLVLATGSNPKIWDLIENSLGHSVVSPVPSLFSFNIDDARIKALSGIATPVCVKIKDTKLSSTGSLLITHWGMSGPAILKLSAWGARILNEKDYRFAVEINWLNTLNLEETISLLKDFKQHISKKTIAGKSPVELTNRLWESLVLSTGITSDTKWADITKIQIQNLAKELTQSEFYVNDKSTFKEEFVTAGGINLKEINFKTMESKLHPNLYFAGEIVNIDAITGGFNFQNAWTSGFIIANNI